MDDDMSIDSITISFHNRNIMALLKVRGKIPVEVG